MCMDTSVTPLSFPTFKITQASKPVNILTNLALGDSSFTSRSSKAATDLLESIQTMISCKARLLLPLQLCTVMSSSQCMVLHKIAYVMTMPEASMQIRDTPKLHAFI